MYFFSLILAWRLVKLENFGLSQAILYQAKFKPSQNQADKFCGLSQAKSSQAAAWPKPSKLTEIAEI